MGSFNLADAVTGVTVPQRARAVAVVIAKRHGGYPDADKAVAFRPMTPTFMFEPVSLPIHGTADDYGNFIPDADSLGARFAWEMTGQPDWETFQDKAFDFRGDGLAIQDDGRWSEIHEVEPREPKPQILGLAVFAESTWKMLHAVSNAPERRERDLCAMRDILRDAVSAWAEADRATDGGRRLYRAISALGFETSGRYEMADGTRVEIPMVGRVLAHGEGGDTFADAFKEWLSQYSDCRGNRLAEGGVTPEVEAFVEGLWEMQEALRGMDYLGKVLTASPSPGYDHNAEFAVELGLLTLRQTTGDMLADVRDNGEGRASEKLQEVVDRIGKIHADLQAGLTKALAFEEYEEPDEEDAPGFAP